ncbi:MAG: hypothetical protein C0605_15890 [Hyphomicrobiales bacterium]|nr:MAG: hypothetical protein C0605_15890 [Hyphomicrobiales bacterium]
MCLQILSAAVSAAGSLMSASQRSAQLKAQARVNERNAEIARDAGAFRMGRMRRDQSRMLGRQIAARGGSGLSLKSGSSIADLDDRLTESELDIEAARYNADKTSSSYKAQAALNRSNAAAARQTGYFNALSPLINAGAARLFK